MIILQWTSCSCFRYDTIAGSDENLFWNFAPCSKPWVRTLNWSGTHGRTSNDYFFNFFFLLSCISEVWYCFSLHSFGLKTQPNHKTSMHIGQAVQQHEKIAMCKYIIRIKAHWPLSVEDRLAICAKLPPHLHSVMSYFPLMDCNGHYRNPWGAKSAKIVPHFRSDSFQKCQYDHFNL